MNYFQDYMQESASESDSTKLPTIGIVVDTNDPQQRGRVRVACPALGDNPDPTAMDVSGLPWAQVSTPFGGFINQGFRANGESITGNTSYGMFNGAKVGAKALVNLIDGNSNMRVVEGFLYDKGGANTMPHGRFKVSGGSEGPLAVESTPISPLYDNFQTAFSNPFFNTGSVNNSAEWMSRVSDYSVAAHGEKDRGIDQNDNDDKNVTLTDSAGVTRNITQGSADNRMGDTPSMSGERDSSLDPQTYCWVTPGFHAISMDDRAGNTRMRFRSTTGHQIILDDTNERIYIGTNKGANWIEMDSCGNIDVHSSVRVNIHAAKDLNFTAGETIRMTAKQVHIHSEEETRITAKTDLHVHGTGNLLMGSSGDVKLHSLADTHIFSQMNVYTSALESIHNQANTSINFESKAAFNILGQTVCMTGQSTVDVLGSSSIKMSGGIISQNGSPAAPAAPATPATEANENPAFTTNRVPQQEPWPRGMLNKEKVDRVAESSKGPTDASKWTSPQINYSEGQSDFQFTSYGDGSIGKQDYDVTYTRNKYWNR